MFDAAPAAIADISCDVSLPTQQTLTASDDCSTVTVSPSVMSTPDVCNGYAVTSLWTATDACGNSTTTSISFNVLADNAAPVFDAAPAAIADISCDDSLPTQQILTASDDLPLPSALRFKRRQYSASGGRGGR